jgi:uncharacterized membrane protein YedE/YeeE
MSPNEELTELQRNWTPPVELSGSGPRDVRLSGIGIFLVCLAGLMFMGAIVAAVGLSRVASRQQADRENLREAGMVTEAVVTRHWRTGGKDDTPRIAYQFEYEGQTWKGTSAAPRSIWRKLDVGSKLEVRFVPSHPELNHPAEWEAGGTPKWLPAVIAALLIGIGMMVGYLIRRQMSLLSEGRPTVGRVTKCSRFKNEYILRYEFATLNGGIAKGRGKARKALPVGGALTILYDRDNPRRNEPYPLELVRVAR